MEWGAVLAAVVFAILGLACLLTVPMGLPGVWMLVGLAALLELADGVYLGAAQPTTFGWTRTRKESTWRSPSTWHPTGSGLRRAGSDSRRWGRWSRPPRVRPERSGAAARGAV